MSAPFQYGPITRRVLGAPIEVTAVPSFCARASHDTLAARASPLVVTMRRPQPWRPAEGRDSRTELTRNLPRLVAAATAIIEPSCRAQTWAHCQRCAPLPTPERAAARTRALTASARCGDTRRWWPSSSQSHDVKLQQRLWKVSEELTGVVYPVG